MAISNPKSQHHEKHADKANAKINTIKMYEVELKSTNLEILE